MLYDGELFMPKYVIEREFPGAGNLTPEQLQGVAQNVGLVTIERCICYY